MLLSALLLLAPSVPPPSPLLFDPDPVAARRQFDFWIGEWSVQNRFLQPDGSWVDADVTRARITPVCAGRALLEEWAGPFRGTFMNGFSLRAWNEPLARWDLVLNWTTDGNGSFGTMHGTFRHGRGEFVSNPSGASRTRYTFSDALEETVRWDSATTQDSGVTWKTDWVMEFSRTRDAAEVTQDVLFSEDWNAGELSGAPEARALDALLGTWTGTRTLADGRTREARLRARALNKDCLVVDVLQWRAQAGEAWNERLAVRGWVPRANRWESWRLAVEDPVLRSAPGTWDGPVLVTEWVGAEGERRREALVLADGALTLEESLRFGDDAWELVATTELSR